MGIEAKINSQLNRMPGLKKVIKRVYQLCAYTISPKIKSEGRICRVSPDGDDYEYFFGYYDKSPWDASGTRMLCLRAKETFKETAPAEPVDILLLHTDTNDVEVIGHSSSWNVQQGCMLQWLGPDFDSRIIFNDFRDGKYCSVVLDIKSGTERVLDKPVYSVSQDGKTALSLDFSRLHRLRPGYGYSNLEEKTKKEKLPDASCIWKVNLETGDSLPLLNYKDFAGFEPRDCMIGAEHKVNHIMINPSGTRFMVLHRWFQGQMKYTRLVTCNMDGTGLYNLSDEDMVSHCCWKDDEHILAFAHKSQGGNGYYFMKDCSQEFTQLWPELCTDGHPSYSPNGSLVVTDTYPNRARIATVKIMHGDRVKTIAKVFAPFKYDNDTRCDLHPRWNRVGDAVCFDSVFEGKRGLYTVKIDAEEFKEEIHGK